MRDNQCHTLLAFWYERQVAGLSPVFRFNKYLVQDELVEGNQRELAEADDHKAEDPPVPGKEHGKTRKPEPKGKRKWPNITSSKGKAKQAASYQVMSSDDSGGEKEFIGVGSDVTATSDEADDELDDIGLNTPYDNSTVTSKLGPPTPGPSTRLQ